MVYHIGVDNGLSPFRCKSITILDYNAMKTQLHVIN